MRSALLIAGSVLALAAGIAAANEPDVSPAEKEVAKRVSRSLWAVLPETPRYKRDLAAERISGSAVAVGEGQLLVACEALSGRVEVALWRHNKYRLGRLTGADAARRACVLSAPDAPLNLLRGFRDPTDLRPGEPVYALFNETSAEVALAEGRLQAATPGAADRGLLRVDLALPDDVRSAVLFDAAGSIVGVGGADPRAALPGAVVAAPLTPALAPGLTNLALGTAEPGPGEPAAAGAAAPMAGPVAGVPAVATAPIVEEPPPRPIPRFREEGGESGASGGGLVTLLKLAVEEGPADAAADEGAVAPAPRPMGHTARGAREETPTAPSATADPAVGSAGVGRAAGAPTVAGTAPAADGETDADDAGAAGSNTEQASGTDGTARDAAASAGATDGAAAADPAGAGRVGEGAGGAAPAGAADVADGTAGAAGGVDAAGAAVSGDTGGAVADGETDADDAGVAGSTTEQASGSDGTARDAAAAADVADDATGAAGGVDAAGAAVSGDTGGAIADGETEVSGDEQDAAGGPDDAGGSGGDAGGGEGRGGSDEAGGAGSDDNPSGGGSSGSDDDDDTSSDDGGNGRSSDDSGNNGSGGGSDSGGGDDN